MKKFYEEAPEKEDVIKNVYIAEIRGYAKYADEEFLAYATDPKNIIVHRELACYLTVTYFYGQCFQGGENFAPLPALLAFYSLKR